MIEDKVLSFKHLVENRVKEREALEAGIRAPFHISVKGSQLNKDCLNIRWGSSNKSSQYGRQRPECIHPELVKQFISDGGMILSCKDCEHFEE